MIQTLSKTVHSAAWAHKGTAEWPGAAHNPQVLDYFRKAGQPMPDDETPWCAAFVGAMLAECGLQGTGSLAARSYLKWGQKVAPDDAGPGDVVVFWRGGKSGWQGHVAFFHRRAEGRIYVLGGNQGNKVSVAGYAPNRLLGIRRATPPPRVRNGLHHGAGRRRAARHRREGRGTCRGHGGAALDICAHRGRRGDCAGRRVDHA